MNEMPVTYQQFVHLDDKIFGEVMEIKESVEEHEGIVSGVGFDEVLNFHHDLQAYVVASIEDQTIGVATIFAPQIDKGELAVCVAEKHRGKGIGRALVRQALAELARFQVDKAILLCDAKSFSGKHFVAALRGEEIFHEYGMRLEGSGTLVTNSRFAIRIATQSDTRVMANMCAAAYGDSYEQSLAFIQTCVVAVQRIGYIGSLAGIPVASCFVSRNEDGISINTVVVDPSYQRRGVATAFLSEIIRPLRNEGRPIILDVNSSNTRALGLYEKLGFSIISDIGYYQILPDYLLRDSL